MKFTFYDENGNQLGANNDENTDFFSVPQIRYKNEYYMSNDEESFPFVVLSDFSILYGYNGTDHRENKRMTRCFNDWLALGRVFLAEDGATIIVFMSNDMNNDKCVRPPYDKKIVSQVINDKGLDKNLVYYYADTSGQSHLNKFIPDTQSQASNPKYRNLGKMTMAQYHYLLNRESKSIDLGGRKDVIDEVVDKVVKEYINESQGIIENGMLEFAEYLWARCQNNQIKPDRYGDVNFTIPSKLWNKFNTYKLNADKVKIRIEQQRSDAIASFSFEQGQPVLTIREDLLYKPHEKFISVLMHELVHFVNIQANEHRPPSILNRDNMYHKVRRRNAIGNSSAGSIEYLYNRTEMNARLNGAYYFLKGELNKEHSKTRNIIDTYVFNGKQDGQFALTQLFKVANLITCYSDMDRLLRQLKAEIQNPKGYTNYIDTINKGETLRYNTPTAVSAYLGYGQNFPNKNHTAEQYFTRKYKIYFFMEKELDNFKTRIYKMIYKFMTEIE